MTEGSSARSGRRKLPRGSFRVAAVPRPKMCSRAPLGRPGHTFDTAAATPDRQAVQLMFMKFAVVAPLLFVVV